MGIGHWEFLESCGYSVFIMQCMHYNVCSHIPVFIFRVMMKCGASWSSGRDIQTRKQVGC